MTNWDMILPGNDVEELAEIVATMRRGLGPLAEKELFSPMVCVFDFEDGSVLIIRRDGRIVALAALCSFLPDGSVEKRRHLSWEVAAKVKGMTTARRWKKEAA